MKHVWSISGTIAGIIYHLLSGSLGQGVTVAQIIDLDISDVVAICNINILALSIAALLGLHDRAVSL